MRRVVLFFAAGALLLGARGAEAQSLISRTITVNGVITDWTQPTNILSNAGQSAFDCEIGQACETDAVQSTGRDLKSFAYTWDSQNLYFYVERYASSTNTTTWLFYLDMNVDGKMSTGERFFVVDWKGSNQSTNAVLCTYVAANAAGDPLGGEGATLPGSNQGNCDAIYYGVDGGTADGLAMESSLPWSTLGWSGPNNVAFHISSSRNLNLPSGVEDNMTGPGGSGSGGGGGGGQLFPPDLAVDVFAADSSISGFQQFTYSVKLTNIYFQARTGVALDVRLPSQLEWISDNSATLGTTFTDTNSDGVPDRWNVGAVDTQQVKTLVITLRGKTIDSPATDSLKATLSAYSGTDASATNNTDWITVTIAASPRLTIAEYADRPTVLPGTDVTYRTLVTNLAQAPAHVVKVEGTIASQLYLFRNGGSPFTLQANTAGVSMGLTEYFVGGSWVTTLPADGAGGAPAGYVNTVTKWRITFTGTMAATKSFEIVFLAQVK